MFWTTAMHCSSISNNSSFQNDSIHFQLFYYAYKIINYTQAAKSMQFIGGLSYILYVKL